MEGIFIKIADVVKQLLGSFGIGMDITSILMALFYAIAIIIFVLLNAVVLVLLERKFGGFMQQRPGPNRLGPSGAFQTLADVVKLFGKELIIPKNADKWVFILATIVVFIPAVMLYAVVPFGKDMIALDLNIGIFYFIAISSTATMAFIMGGWGSNNKYSLIGGMRTVAQMVSYEIPLVFSLLGVIMIAGSLRMSDIIAAQKDVWFVILQPVAFIIFFIASVAELNRGPFDLPEGEQELVAGTYTEYSGMMYALFFLAEYANIVSVSAIAVTLFWGGWQGPILPSWLWFVIKLYIMIFMYIWVRWTFPRIRVDHLMHLNWKFLLPLSLANVLVTGIVIKFVQLFKWF